jgi:hypothetical protein
MMDFCARCYRNVNSNSYPFSLDLGGVYLCREYREQMLK